MEESESPERIAGVMKTLDLPTGKRRRGNPEWGKPVKPANVLVTEFDAEVRRLGLTKPEYVASPELKRWCDRSRNRVYVPEWLLGKWGMQVETDSGRVA